MTLDGARCAATFDLRSNGTFVSTEYHKFSERGVESGGVMRGRWNVYYSEDSKHERFWMQVLRLKSTAVALSHDLLLLGDLDVVDTWVDLQHVLAHQLLDTNENNTTNLAADEQEMKTPSPSLSPSPQPCGERVEESGWLTTTPEDRGIFTSGPDRTYRLAGTILVGWMGEPAVVGDYHMVQSKSALLPASEQDGGADMLDAHPQDDALNGPDDAPL